MLLNITQTQLAEAMLAKSHCDNMKTAMTLAQIQIDCTDSLLEPAVKAWMNNEEIPDIKFGDFSLHQVQKMEEDRLGYKNIPESILLFSGYINNSEHYDSNLKLRIPKIIKHTPPYFVRKQNKEQ